jgi:hypothetical protein
LLGDNTKHGAAIKLEVTGMDGVDFHDCEANQEKKKARHFHAGLILT